MIRKKLNMQYNNVMIKASQHVIVMSEKSLWEQKNKKWENFYHCVKSNKHYFGIIANFYSVRWASLVAQLVNNLLAMRETWVNPWVGKISWRGKGYALQYSGLENSMDCIGHGATKSQTRLSDFHSVWY